MKIIKILTIFFGISIVCSSCIITYPVKENPENYKPEEY